MILSAIAAMAKNRVIGRDNGLPWHIPEDMKFFREKTKGHIMIMGRKTFDSFGAKPLPGRPHIVITRNPDFRFEHPEVTVVGTFEEAVSAAEKLTPKYGDEVFVIGGGEIYKHALSHLQRIYLTVIDQDFEGDAFFPEFDLKKFKLTSKNDRLGPPAYSFQIFET